MSYNYPGVWEWFIRGADSKCFDWCLTNPQDLLVGVEIYKSWLYMHCYCAYSGWPKDKSITDYNLDDYSPSADRLFTGFGGGEIEMRSAGYEDADIAVCYKNNVSVLCCFYVLNMLDVDQNRWHILILNTRHSLTKHCRNFLGLLLYMPTNCRQYIGKIFEGR